MTLDGRSVMKPSHVLTALLLLLPLSTAFAGQDWSKGTYRIEENGDEWRIWSQGRLLWQGHGPIPESLSRGSELSRGDNLIEIASWECPGNVFTGGQFHSWDLNANDIPDLAYSNWQDDTYVYEAIGDNNFQQMHTYPNPPGSYATTLVCTGDGDSDGLAELIFATGTSGVPRDIFFVESQALGSYPDDIVLVLPEEVIGVNHMRMSDLDGDNLREYVGTTQGTHVAHMAIWESRGDNDFTRVYFYPSSGGVSGEVAVGDFDGDGLGDVVFPENSSQNIIHVVEAVANDTYVPVWSAVVPTDNMYWVTPGPDLDRDGRGDFVVSGGSSSAAGDRAVWSFIMYESVADNVYQAVWSHQLAAGIIDGGSATGDVDGDGYPELICQVPDRTLAFRYAGDNNLELYWEHAGSVNGQGEHRIVAPDLDGDTAGEVVWWTQSGPGVLVVYEDPEPGTSYTGDPGLIVGAAPLVGHPNPFGSTTVLRYGVPRDGYVRLDVCNVLGRRVASLVDGWTKAGRHSIRWDAEGMAPGIYFCRLRAGGSAVSRKLVRQ